MELYLFKSAAILAMLFAFYKVFLENTSIHNFKRFYLFGSLIAAFLIPLITFKTYVEVSPFIAVYTEGTPQIAIVETVENISYWPFVLWTIYGLGVLFFSAKFFRNLFNLIQKIRQNPKYRNSNFINVLLRENVIPHTFFSYIFLNKNQFENGEIPAEVILHEQTHAIQKHSLDVIFVELLQILFWFNPLFYFIKKSIKLNHEFLADRAVINDGTKISEYQKIVLAFSSNVATPSLAHSLHYSSIKKRFTVMKTHTSKRAIWLRSLLILPLLCVLVYGFSTTHEISKTTVDANKILKDTTSTQKITLEVFDNKIFLNQKEVSITNFSKALNAYTENWEKKDFNLYALDIKVENTSDDFREKINAEYRTTYLAKQSVQENPFIIYPTKENKLISNSDASLNHLNEVEKNGGIIKYEGTKISSENAKKLIRQNPLLNIVTQNFGLSKSITTISKEPIDLDKPQSKATKSQLGEYNKLAKKYNAIAIEKRIIPLKDLKVLETIYREMTLAQRAKAQPFPECNQTQNYSVTEDNKKFSEASYYYKGKKINFEKANELLDQKNNIGIYISQNPNEQNTIHLFEEPFDAKKVVIQNGPKTPTAENENLYMAAEAPPAPISDPVEYIKELAKSGAIFYIGTQKYTRDEAIELVKKSTNEVTIDVSKYPMVLLNGC